MGTAIITRCDTTPVLELPQQVFDPVSLSIKMPVVRQASLSGFCGWNTGCNAPGGEGFPEAITIVSLIGNQMAGIRKGGKQDASPFVIAHLPFCQKHGDRTPCTITDSMKLRIQTTACPSDPTGSPFLRSDDAVR